MAMTAAQAPTAKGSIPRLQHASSNLSLILSIISAPFPSPAGTTLRSLVLSRSDPRPPDASAACLGVPAKGPAGPAGVRGTLREGPRRGPQPPPTRPGGAGLCGVSRGALDARGHGGAQPPRRVRGGGEGCRGARGLPCRGIWGGEPRGGAGKAPVRGYGHPAVYRYVDTAIHGTGIPRYGTERVAAMSRRSCAPSPALRRGRRRAPP